MGNKIIGKGDWLQLEKMDDGYERVTRNNGQKDAVVIITIISYFKITASPRCKSVSSMIAVFILSFFQ